MDILVSGGAGFIGANITRYLSMDGFCAVALDNLSSGDVTRLTDVTKKASFVGASAHLVDSGDVPINPQVVVHCAGVFSPNAVLLAFNKTFNYSVGSTANLCRIFPHAKHVFFSESECLVKEPHNPSGPSLTFRSMIAMASVYSVDFCVIHTPYIFGKYEPVYGGYTTLSSILSSAVDDRPIRLGNFGLYETEFSDMVTVASVVSRVCHGKIKSKSVLVSGVVTSWKSIYDEHFSGHTVSYNKDVPLLLSTSSDSRLIRSYAESNDIPIVYSGAQELRSYIRSELGDQ